MKCLQWNVNGLRSILKNKTNRDIFTSMISKYDLISLNEIKIDETTLAIRSDDFVPQGYYLYSSHAQKKGYSGVCIITKYRPLHTLEQTLGNDEGRLIILEFSKLIVIGVYVPNSGQRTTTGDRLPKRIEYRVRSWDPHFQSLCLSLRQRKPLLILGDMNVAHKEIDINNPTIHKQSAGFTDMERYNFGLLLDSVNLVDVWRELHKRKKQYTYFDYRTRARSRNVGWRLDYALVSKEILHKVSKCEILSDVVGSDHVPIELILQLDLIDKK